MANKGTKKKKSNYSNMNRITNRLRRLTKHAKDNPNDKDVEVAIKNIK